MAKFDGLKVSVEGRSTTPMNITNSPIKTVSVDMRNQTANTKSSDQQKFFHNCRVAVYRGNLSPMTVSNMVVLEIKRMYFECISDDSFDLSSIKYMDDMLFNDLKEVISYVVQVKTTTSDSNLDSIKEMTLRMINNSIKLLEYDSHFEGDKLYDTIDNFFKEFTK